MEKIYKSDTDVLREFSDVLLTRHLENSCMLPLKSETEKYLNELLRVLFPQFSDRKYYNSDEINGKIYLLERDLKNILLSLRQNYPAIDPDDISRDFTLSLPSVFSMLLKDAEAIYMGDPAAESREEVILAYPGFFAITVYRIAHEFYKLQVPILPRILSEHAHTKTGIDIHPGAKIGESFCIDHGTGIVIGETTEIGKNVKIYQGVTLGALSVEKNLAQKKRHPTIEDDVVIYAQAVILGGKTVIGRNSIIGGNAWLTDSVPSGSVVYHKSEVRVRINTDLSNVIDFSI